MGHFLKSIKPSSMSLFDDFLESTEPETIITQDDQKPITTPSRINKVKKKKRNIILFMPN
jgi:hypothetical protein